MVVPKVGGGPPYQAWNYCRGGHGKSYLILTSILKLMGLFNFINVNFKEVFFMTR